MTHGSIFDKIWKRMRTPERRCKVAMFHIDLGIGGAEHLFLHAALAAYLFQNGYGKDVVNLEAKKVDVFTTRFDPQRCLATAKSRKLLGGRARLHRLSTFCFMHYRIGQAWT